MASKRLTITAAITTFNQARYLAATLESVLEQTRPPDDIVVVDDGSTDETPTILASYAPRVRVIRQANAGVAAARNRAVLASSGEFVALLDGDDIWLPRKLERCVDAGGGRQNSPIIVHDIETVSADGSAVLQRAPLRDLLAGSDLARSDAPAVPGMLDAWSRLLTGNFIWTTSQVIIRRDAYISAGLSDSRFPIASDYDLYLRLAEREPFFIVPDVLARWRQHEASASGAGADRHLNWGMERINVLRARAEFADRSRREALRQASSGQLAEMAREVYLLEAANGRWRTAVNLFRLATRYQDVRCGTLATGVLMPSGLRRAAASLIGWRLW